MPQMTTILLKKDDASDVTLVPVSDTPNPHWRTNISGIAAAGQVRLEEKAEEMKNGRVRVNVKLTLPIMEVVPSGTVNAAGFQAAPIVADEEAISMTAYFSPRGSNETRADLVRMFAHLVSGATSVSGGSAYPQSSTADTFRDVSSASPAPYGLVNLLWPS